MEKLNAAKHTDLDEFYSSIDIKSFNILKQLRYLEHYYNWNRPYRSLASKTPNEKYSELMFKTPLHEGVSLIYDLKKNLSQRRHYNTYFEPEKSKQFL